MSELKKCPFSVTEEIREFDRLFPREKGMFWTPGHEKIIEFIRFSLFKAYIAGVEDGENNIPKLGYVRKQDVRVDEEEVRRICDEAYRKWDSEGLWHDFLAHAIATGNVIDFWDGNCQ